MSSQLSKISRKGTNRLDPDLSAKSAVRLAVKEADIRAFEHLIRERRRLSARTNENNSNDYIESGLYQLNESRFPIVQQQIVKPKSIAGHDSTLEPAIIATAQMNPKTMQRLELTIASDQQNKYLVRQNSIERLVAVMHRLVLNNNQAPSKQWLIQLRFGGDQSLQLTLELLGKNEWRIGFREQDKSDHGKCSCTDSESLLEEVIAELSDKIPFLRISTMQSVKGA